MNMKKPNPMGNKKAQLSYYVSMLIVKMILLAMVITFICLVIFILVAGDIGTENIRAEIFLERALSSPACFAYFDEELGKSFPNIINYSKFDRDVLIDCMDYGDNGVFISAEFVLYKIGTEKEIKTVYFNKDSFDTWLPFAFDKKYLNFNGQRYVIIRDEEETYSGKIKYSVVTPSG